MLDLAPEARRQGAAKHMSTIKPFLLAYMHKKVGSRVLQLIFKWGEEPERKLIYECLRQNWKDLVRSPETLRLIQTTARTYKLTEIEEDAFILQGSFKGAKILQQHTDNDAQAMEHIKNKFYGLREAAAGKDVRAQETLHNLALKSIEKEYYYLPLSKLCLRLALGSMFAE